MPHYGGMALLLDTEDVSDALGVSVPTVKRLIRGGALPAVKVAGATRVRRADLEAYVAGLDSVTAPPKASTPPTPATAGGTGNQGGEGHSLPVDPPAPPVGRGGRTVDRPPQAHPERTAS